jgi:AAA15 family ATPase/GTPase
LEEAGKGCMAMGNIQQLSIKKFRGINGLELSKLGMVNLFVGPNNSGKTSVLEAIELFSDPFEPGNYARLARLRDYNRFFPLIEYVLWLFPKKEVAKLSDKEDVWDFIQIEGSNDDRINKLTIKPKFKKMLKSNMGHYIDRDSIADNVQMELFDEFSPDITKVLELAIKYEHGEEIINKRLSFTERNDAYRVETTNFFRTVFLTPIDYRIRQTSAKAINDIIISGDRPKIIDILKLFDENILGVEILSPDGRVPIPAINHKKLGIVPLFLFGDGVRKAMALATAVVRSESGLLLIDELETAIHPYALKGLFSWLVNSCKLFNVQLFATTHSLEATDAVLEASEESLRQLVIYRLENDSEKTFAKRFSGETLHTLRFELGQDVR